MPNENEGDQNTGNDRNWRQLEKARDTALETAQAWQKVAMQGLVASGGFDPQDPVVSLLVKEFTSTELDPGELSHTSFAEFAKKYNVEPKAPEPPPQATPQPTVQEQIAALQAQAGQPQVPQPVPPGAPQAPPAPVTQHMGFQAPADALLTSSGSLIQPPATGDNMQRAAQAEAQGDYVSSFNAKFAQVRQIYEGNPPAAPHAGAVNPQGLPVHTPTQQ